MTGRTPSDIRLRRGLVSRLTGDVLMPSVCPIQAVFLVALLVDLPNGWDWAVRVPLALLTLVSVTWSARISGGRLVGSVLGVPTLIVSLAESKDAGVEQRDGPLGAKPGVVVIHDAAVDRRSLVFRTLETVDYLDLGFTRNLGRKQLQEWAHAIRTSIHAQQ